MKPNLGLFMLVTLLVGCIIAAYQPAKPCKQDVLQQMLVKAQSPEKVVADAKAATSDNPKWTVSTWPLTGPPYQQTVAYYTRADETVVCGTVYLGQDPIIAFSDNPAHVEPFRDIASARDAVEKWCK